MKTIISIILLLTMSFSLMSLIVRHDVLNKRLDTSGGKKHVQFYHLSGAESPRIDPILTRHDKDEAEFLKIAKRFDKYICHLNLPDCEGTIIADQWAISAAHCAVVIMDKFEKGLKHFVIINDVEIEVDKVIMYEEWNKPLEDISVLNDIALLHLKTKPIDAIQAKLYDDEDELDKLIYMVGRGDNGNGLTGVAGNNGKLKGVTNRIETVSKKWLTWTFDHPDTQTKYLTEFEGISGPGDSGGPAFILKNDTVYIAGISSWQDQKGGEEGLYGVVENYTRVSQYIEWINNEMNGTGNSLDSMIRIEPKTNAIDDRPVAIYVDASTLKRYVGEYEIEERTIKIHTNEKGTILYVSVPSHPSYELVPTAENKFSFRRLTGFSLEFKTLKNDVFTQIIATQPDGVNKLTRK